ncbi:unnamed protein product [Litomosoides sigmodontis]|uniref:Uncharacterized protein n=1 Tax=Litomosoides sigmodontis TaxID=42156 RepID=A0A3P6TB23_LITSI|nr:unnamed protein product [Litomosoides sigmodontis]
MNNAECAKDGANHSMSDLQSKIRSKSYRFMDDEETTSSKHVANFEISKIDSLEKLSSLANLHNNHKTRSFLHDFRKLFGKNKSSTDIMTSATTTSTTATTTIVTVASSSSVANSPEINYSLGDVELESPMEDLTHSVTSLRTKSQFWSDRDDREVFQRCQKSNQIGSKVAIARVRRNNRKIGFITKFATGNIEYESAVHSKVSLIYWSGNLYSINI